MKRKRIFWRGGLSRPPGRLRVWLEEWWASLAALRKDSSLRPRQRLRPMRGWVEPLEERQLLCSYPPSIQYLGLTEDTGTPNDGGTINPAIVGSIGVSGSLSNVEIGVDQNGDGLSEGYTYTNSNGQFEYNPQGLTPGPVASYVQPVQSCMRTLYGPWVSFSFTLTTSDTQQQPPEIVDLQLVVDTGTVRDRITADLRVKGKLRVNGSGTSGQVEVDLNGDGSPDAQTLASDTGLFEFEPQSVSPGAQTWAFRGVGSGSSNYTVAGSWSNFPLESRPAPVQVHGYRPLRDTGDSNSDGITAWPTRWVPVSDDWPLLKEVRATFHAISSLDGSMKLGPNE
jgi:hypothetical protein